MLRYSKVLLLIPTNCVNIVTRGFARKASFSVQPLNIERKNKPLRPGPYATNRPWKDADFRDIPPEIREEFQNSDNQFEPNLGQIGPAYNDYLRDEYNMRLMVKRSTLKRRHFSDLKEREISLLTWAEKQNIRHLHESDPDTWTPDALAAAFPITTKGVVKLLKSKVTLTQQKYITAHDLLVQERIFKIKNGQIELTRELKEKMRIREKTPVQVGVMVTNTKELDIYEPLAEPLGEFARIVASPEKIREADERYARFSSNKIEEREAKIDALFKKEMSSLNIKSRLTLSELEEKLNSPSKTARQERLRDSVPEVRYLLGIQNVNKYEPRREVVPESSSSINKFVRAHITKYKRDEESEEGEEESTSNEGTHLKKDGKELYLYDPKTGYQKPFSSDSYADKINIPEEQRVPGAVYRVGNSYYDDSGNFMYRVL